MIMAMRYLICAVTVLTMAPSILWARSDEIPTPDVRPVCRGIASQSADPGVGQTNRTETFQQCLESEKTVFEQLKREWSGFSAGDKRHCVTLATTGGESSNTELLTCLEMARDVRTLRSAAAAPSGTEQTKPASSPGRPVEPQPSGPTSAPNSDKEVRKTEDKEAKRELERAAAEAQSAKASEASTQRKLADAEAALKQAKEEVARTSAEATRASAEATRAKAEAQSAREAEASANHKLADAEAARAKAEQAFAGRDKTQSGFGARLRRWLGRPSPQNP
jgi:hypothetical protein